MSNNIANKLVDKNEIINLKIVSRTNGESLHHKCRAICFASQSGQVQVLTNHIPMIANIQANTQIIIADENDENIVLETNANGFFTFNQNHCLITLQNYTSSTQTKKENLKKAS